MEESENHTLHICFKNYKNSLCYLITVVQKLHSSPTLNKIVKENDLNSLPSFQKDLMIILKTYAELTKENVDEIYVKINKLFEDFGDKYISDIYDGYVPQCVLYYYYMPIIRKICNDTEFNNICTELNLFKRSKDNLDYKTNDIFTGNLSWFKPEFQDDAKQQYLNNKYEIKTDPNSTTSVCAICSLFPNKQHSGGHAVVLLKILNKGWYIIDDNNNFEKFSEYIENCRGRLYKIEIQDIDDNSAKELNLESRVHRYAKILKGGASKKSTAKHQCLAAITTVSVIGAITILALIIYSVKKHKKNKS